MRSAIEAALHHYFGPLEQQPMPERFVRLLALMEPRQSNRSTVPGGPTTSQPRFG